jgi:hypothetical protein
MAPKYKEDVELDEMPNFIKDQIPKVTKIKNDLEQDQVNFFKTLITLSGFKEMESIF